MAHKASRKGPGPAPTSGLIAPPIKIGVLQADVPLRKRETADGSLSSNPHVKFFTNLQQVKIVDIWDLGEGFSALIENPFLCPTTAELTPAGERAIETDGLFRRKFAPDRNDNYLEAHVRTAASRVLLIDIDGIVVEGERWREDLEGFAREVVRRVLPERFHNVTFWASLSASAGIKRKGDAWSIGLHVVFVTDRPLDDDQRKALVRQGAPEVPPGAGKLDTSTLSSKQMYFTARPEFRGEDPVPNRSTMVASDVDEVVLEQGLEARLHSARHAHVGTAQTGSRPTQLAAGFEAKMALLGDGPGLDGFHRVIRDAIYAFCGENDGNVDCEQLKANVRAHIDAAPKASGRKSTDIDRYNSDAYLDDSIRGAIALISRDKYAPRAFELPTGTIEGARDELHKGIAKFEGWVTSIEQADLDQVGEVGSETASPMVMGIQTPTGSGKTKAAVELAVRLLKQGIRPVIAASTHDLCEEIAASLRSQGVAAEVYRGFTAVDPAAGTDSEGEPILMCRDAEYATLLRKAGVKLDDICSICEHRHTCGYRGQMGKKERTQIWVIPHALLGHVRPIHTIAPVDVVIVDEDPIDALLTGFGGRLDALTPADLLKPDPDAGYLLTMERERLAKMIAGWKITNDFWYAPMHRRKLLRRASELRKRLPATREERFKAALEIIALRFEAAAWEAISKGGIGLRVRKDKNKKPELRLFQRLFVTKDWTLPTLILDATPEWDLYRQFWDITEIISISCDMPQVHVRQVLFSASASKLDESETGQNNLNKVRRIVEAVSAGARRVLVAGQLKVKNNLAAPRLPRRIETAHFNALRGLDRWGDVDQLFVIGRTEPPPDILEVTAEALFREKVETLPDGEYYPQVSVGLNTRSSETATHAVLVSRHPDERLELLRKRAVVNELVQAVGRGRGGNRTEENPLQVVLINTVPLPIAIDEVVSWNDAQPTPAEIIAGRYDLVIENPAAYGAAGLIRDLLPDAAASRATQHRKRSLSQTPNENSHKAFETVRPPDRPGRLIRSGARYAVPVRYRHGLWRPLREGEVPPGRAIQRQLFGRPYVLVPRDLADLMPDIYFAER